MELASQPRFWGRAARLTLVRRLQEQSREEISRKKQLKIAVLTATRGQCLCHAEEMSAGGEE